MLDREAYLKFRRPHDECLLCGTSLPAAGKHPTVLDIDGKEEAIRRDFCPKCWVEAEKPEYFGFWLTKRIDAPTGRERRLARAERNEALWRLFNALHETENPELRPQLFLLAHLLMRYRVLTFRSTEADGTLLFEHQPSGVTFRVADVPIESVPFAEVKKAVESEALKYAPSAKKDEEA